MFYCVLGILKLGETQTTIVAFLQGARLLQKLIFSPVKSGCLFFFPFIARAIPLQQQRAVAMVCIYTQRFEKQVRKIEVMLYFDAKLSQYYPIAKYTMEVGDKTYLLLALSWSLVLK